MAYAYKKKPFAVDDSDSDGDDVDLFSLQSAKKQKLGGGVGRPRKDAVSSGTVVNLASQASVTASAKKGTPANSAHNVKNEVSVDEPDYIEILSSQSASTKAEPVAMTEEEIQFMNSFVEDPAVVKAKEELAKLKRLRTAAQHCDSNGGNYVSSSSSSASYVPSRSVHAPKIKTATERCRERESRVQIMMDESKPAGSSSSSAVASAATIDAADRLRIKTRLNNKHEYMWVVSNSYSVKQLKGLFRQVYGLAADEKVSLEYDGERLQEGSTLEDCDLMDEDLVDAKIQGHLIADASKHADKFKNEGRVASLGAPTTAPKPVAAVPVVQSATVNNAPEQLVDIFVEFPVHLFNHPIKRMQIRVKTSFALSLVHRECLKPTKANCSASMLGLARGIDKKKDPCLDITKTIGQLGLEGGTILYALPM